ncbi:hypothetical protein Mal15_42640 [Stieleria maiorica]|uniref:Uncharacterized protein n=1 Tax=Stieleria maiorica TaxID=2795974 RepID=A0A5B9MKK7_9BACT|nr:hypothetical protein [Stieleria maiorica]QEG00195.1 hypothetical protein Mal15_42640 [Stieleria maiorica]
MNARKLEYLADAVCDYISVCEQMIVDRSRRIAAREDWLKRQVAEAELNQPVRVSNSGPEPSFPALPTEVQDWLNEVHAERAENIMLRVHDAMYRGTLVEGIGLVESTRKIVQVDKELVDLFREYVDLLIDYRDRIWSELENRDGEKTHDPPRQKKESSNSPKSAAELRIERDNALLNYFLKEKDEQPTNGELKDWLANIGGDKGWELLDSETGIAGALRRAWARQNPESPKWPFDRRGRPKKK